MKYIVFYDIISSCDVRSGMDYITEDKANEYWLAKLAICASKFYRKKSDGSYSFIDDEGEYPYSFWDALEHLDDVIKDNSFCKRLAKRKSLKTIVNFRDVGDFIKVADYLNDIGLLKFNILRGGDNSIVLSSASNKAFNKAIVLRISLKDFGSKRIIHGAVLQSCFCSEASNVDFGCLHVELLPRVVTLRNLLQKAGVDTNDNRTYLYKMFVNSLGDDVLDTDPNNIGNIGVLPDGTLVNLDAQAIMLRSELSPKKLNLLQKISSELKMYNMSKKPFDFESTTALNKQKLLF